MQKLIHLFLTILLIIFITYTVKAQKKPKIGIRAGIGTDINLGLVYGFGANYLITNRNNSLELGVVFFGGSFDEATDGIHRYEETTDIIVFGALANYLISYKPKKSGIFFISGVGLALINVEWEERSDGDSSLGTPLPGGGSKQSDDGSSAGAVLNLGIGLGFKNGLDLRAETPLILLFDSPGEATSVAPTFMVTLGYRF